MKTLVLKEKFPVQFQHNIVGHCETFYDVEIETSYENEFLLNVRGRAVITVSQNGNCFRGYEDSFSSLVSDYVFSEPPDWWPRKEVEAEEVLPFFSYIKALFTGQPKTRLVKKTVYDDYVELEGYYTFTIPVAQIKMIKNQ
jgi:hypothetical protein